MLYFPHSLYSSPIVLQCLLRMCIISICLLRLLRKLVMRTSYWACAAAGSEILASENRGRAQITRLQRKSIYNMQLSPDLHYPFPSHTLIILLKCALLPTKKKKENLKHF